MSKLSDEQIKAYMSGDNLPPHAVYRLIIEEKDAEIAELRKNGLLRIENESLKKQLEESQKEVIGLEIDVAALKAGTHPEARLEEKKGMSWVKTSESVPEKTEPAYWVNDKGVREVRKENDHALVVGFNNIKGIYLVKYNQNNTWSEVASFGVSTTSDTIPEYWAYTGRPNESFPLPVEEKKGCWRNGQYDTPGRNDVFFVMIDSNRDYMSMAICEYVQSPSGAWYWDLKNSCIWNDIINEECEVIEYYDPSFCVTKDKILEPKQDFFSAESILASKFYQPIDTDWYYPVLEAMGQYASQFKRLPDARQEAIAAIESKFNELLNGDTNIFDRLSVICSKAALDSMYTDYAQSINPTESYLVATGALIAWELKKHLEQKQKEG